MKLTLAVQRYMAFEVATTLSESIEHNFGQFPIIQVIRLDGVVIVPNITHIDKENVFIEFNNTFSGTIIMVA